MSNFQSLEVVSRYRDPQLQVTEKLLIHPNLTLTHQTERFGLTLTALRATMVFF